MGIIHNKLNIIRATYPVVSYFSYKVSFNSVYLLII